jgi:hypothetical protein
LRGGEHSGSARENRRTHDLPFQVKADRSRIAFGTGDIKRVIERTAVKDKVRLPINECEGREPKQGNDDDLMCSHEEWRRIKMELTTAHSLKM